VKTKPPRKTRKRKNHDDTDEMTAPMDSSSSMAARKRRAESLIPKFEVGEKVKFASEDGKEWLYGTISQWILPDDPRNTLDHPHVVVMYLIDHPGGRQSQIEEDLIDHTIYGQENPRFRMHPEGKSGLKESIDYSIKADKYSRTSKLISEIICLQSGVCCIN
jgi:hypothetical protein